MGTFADQCHRTKLIAMGVAAWSFLTAVSGMAKGFVSLAIPRMFIGVGESILTPTSMSLLSDCFPSIGWGLPRLLLHGGADRCRCESLDCRLFRPADRLAKLFLCVGRDRVSVGWCDVVYPGPRARSESTSRSLRTKRQGSAEFQRSSKRSLKPWVIPQRW